MGKWTHKPKNRPLFSTVFLAALGVMGMGVLVMIFAINASSAPSGFNNPAILGHNPADIEAGTFYKNTDPTKNVWSIPGVLGIANASPATNAVAFTINQTAGGAGMYAILAQAVAAQVLRLESSSTGGTQIGLLNTTDAQEWRIGTGITDDDEFVVRDETMGSDRLTIESNGQIGVGTKDPAVALDVVGDVCSSLNGGQCISQLDQTIAMDDATVAYSCNPNCTGGTLTSTITIALCGDGLDDTLIPLNCSGKVMAPGAKSLKTYRIEPQYEALGDSVNGCILEWALNDSTTANVTGFVKATCVKVNP